MTIGVQVAVCVVRIEPGVQDAVTEVMVLGTATVTVAMPDLVVSCVEVAVRVAVPAAVGMKTPAPLTEPMLDGDTVQVTAEL